MADKNYTQEQSDELETAYVDAGENYEKQQEVVKDFAARWGRSPGSIRSKLVSIGVYKKKVYKKKDGTKSESKADIVADLARTYGINEASLNGLENATVVALQTVRNTWAQLTMLAAGETDNAAE